MAGETNPATLGGGAQDATPWPGLRVRTRGNNHLLGEEEGGGEALQAEAGVRARLTGWAE